MCRWLNITQLSVFNVIVWTYPFNGQLYKTNKKNLYYWDTNHVPMYHVMVTVWDYLHKQVQIL